LVLVLILLALFFPPLADRVIGIMLQLLELFADLIDRVAIPKNASLTGSVLSFIRPRR
ncbi:MAG: hypothetical protein HYZ09_03610, partial [Candidatus Kerfeldbacteria bacterium]|nr:hypothetical protein [Candidatus Kerfeldbacteria bacterium]